MRKFSIQCILILGFGGFCSGKVILDGTGKYENDIECLFRAENVFDVYQRIMRKNRNSSNVVLSPLSDMCRLTELSEMSQVGGNIVSIDDDDGYSQTLTVFFKHIRFQCDFTVLPRYDDILEEVNKFSKTEFVTVCGNAEIAEQLHNSKLKFTSDYTSCLQENHPGKEPQTTVKTSVSGIVRNVTFHFMLEGDLAHEKPKLEGKVKYLHPLMMKEMKIEYPGVIEAGKCVDEGLAKSVCTCLTDSNFGNYVLNMYAEKFMCGDFKVVSNYDTFPKYLDCREFAESERDEPSKIPFDDDIE